MCVNGKFSGWIKVLSGVPQGVLGPVLFLLFINDLDTVAVERQWLMKFADDNKLAQIIKNDNDAEELQETLNKMCTWARSWGMEFNVTKCHVMHVGRHNKRHIYSMDGTALAETKEERDIGVVVSNNLKPTAQCKKAAQTANAVLGQIQRAFHFRDRHTCLDLYKQQVRPHLEFAVDAGSPRTMADIDCLERVQQKAVKAVSGLKGRTYEERLTEVGLLSLRDRRKETDMVQTFKIVRGIDVVEDFLEERASARPQTRQNG